MNRQAYTRRSCSLNIREHLLFANFAPHDMHASLTNASRLIAEITCGDGYFSGKA
ncbi:hypothetical protein SAMN06265370_11813 [Puniceibacterium sediminis]|uniref:Uncharacterized protein n=1 Tax=Puniceibacterium sediminis TaxID=1608407 RepID=A0A238YL48_9RHOB|nr:hypothetical protein SAMN06265370_11813 [Puniceibacterium sediminis]